MYDRELRKLWKERSDWCCACHFVAVSSGTMLLVQLSCQLSVTSPPTHKQIGPVWYWFLGGWVCVHSRTMWVSPTNPPVRLGVSPAAATPHRCFQSEVWGIISWSWSPGLCSLSRSPVFSPSLSACKCGTTCFASCSLAWFVSSCLAMSPLHRSCAPQLPVSAPPTDLDECFFFKSLVVRLTYSWIFCQFWVFLFSF